MRIGPERRAGRQPSVSQSLDGGVCHATHPQATHQTARPSHPTSCCSKDERTRGQPAQGEPGWDTQLPLVRCIQFPI